MTSDWSIPLRAARAHARCVVIAGERDLVGRVAFAALEAGAAQGFVAQVFVAGASASMLRALGLDERCVSFACDVRAVLERVPVRPTLAVLGPGSEGALSAVLRLVGAGGGVLLDRLDHGGSLDVVEAGGRFTLGRSRVEGAAPAWLADDVYDELAAASNGSDEARARAGERRAREALASHGVAWREAGPWPFVGVDRSLPRSMPARGARGMRGERSWPRISVVTPSFNQGGFLEETILSVRNQGYPNVEHIVVDGGSTDATRVVLERYRGLLARVVVEPDRGQSDAINKGFGLATGEILTWLNSDDMLAPGALARAALGFEVSGADMIAGRCLLHRGGAGQGAGEVVQEHLTACLDGPLPLRDLLDLEGCWLAGQFFYQPEVMFTRRIFDRAGGRVDAGSFYSMDYELWLRLAHAGARLHVVGSPMAYYRVHEGQKTATPEGYREELPRVRERFLRAHALPDPGPRAPPRRSRVCRFVFFNDVGWSYGAGIAHRRLAQAVASLGHEVVAIAGVRHAPGMDPSLVTIGEAMERIRAAGPDAVVVGNLHGIGGSRAGEATSEAELLGAIAREFPTVFVMHDLWLLSGRCAYPGSCDRFRSGCDARCACPGEYPRLDPSRVAEAWESKRHVLTGERPPTILGDSRWTSERARAALADDPRVRAGAPAPGIDWIRYGFELDEFRPRDRVACRDELGLPRDAFIIMTASASVRDPRKGIDHLARALERLRLPRVIVIAAGWFGKDESPPIPGLRAMGYCEERGRLARMYAAADLFVGPSLEEAFGQVFVEAAACGTPSVAYPVGGVPEALADGLSGRLAERVDDESLAEAIRALHDDAGLRGDMARWARLWVENEWSMELAAHRFVGVLREERPELGLARKVGFVRPRPPAPEASVLAPLLPAWRPGEGFGRWQANIPNLKIPRSIWAHGPIACFEIEGSREGSGTLVVTYRCWIEGQRVRLVRQPEVIGEQVVATTPEPEDRVLEFGLWMRAGTNRFQFHFDRWYLGLEGPTVSMLVTSIAFVPRG